MLSAGRVDDVINVSGHRIGTAEVEGALTQHPQCAEAAVVPVEHPIKGQGIYAYVTLMVVRTRAASLSYMQLITAMPQLDPAKWQAQPGRGASPPVLPSRWAHLVLLPEPCVSPSGHSQDRNASWSVLYGNLQAFLVEREHGT